MNNTDKQNFLDEGEVFLDTIFGDLINQDIGEIEILKSGSFQRGILNKIFLQIIGMLWKNLMIIVLAARMFISVLIPGLVARGKRKTFITS